MTTCKKPDAESRTAMILGHTKRYENRSLSWLAKADPAYPAEANGLASGSTRSQLHQTVRSRQMKVGQWIMAQ